MNSNKLETPSEKFLRAVLESNTLEIHNSCKQMVENKDPAIGENLMNAFNLAKKREDKVVIEAIAPYMQKHISTKNMKALKLSNPNLDDLMAAL